MGGWETEDVYTCLASLRVVSGWGKRLVRVWAMGDNVEEITGRRCSRWRNPYISRPYILVMATEGEEIKQLAGKRYDEIHLLLRESPDS